MPVTPTIPDDAGEWASAWQDRLNDDESFADTAAGLDVRLLCEIEPDDAYDGDPVRFVVEVRSGTVPEAGPVDGDADYDIALRGPYGAWKAMLQGDLDVVSAVMGDTFAVDGSTLTLVGNREAFIAMIRQAQRVDTEFGY